MSYANPTPLRVGARGSLHGWQVRVAGRLVLGVEIDGETYYWNEFHLVGDNGNTGTLVFEDTEHGPEWKLFREFQPIRAMTAHEAATKRVGDTVNLDGTPTRITLVDESRVYHIEGEAPEGVSVGDVAHYFNADRGQRMLVASWTGDEIEFYEGQDVPATLVAQTFKFPGASRSLAPGASSTSPASGAARPSTSALTKVVVVLFFVAVAAAVVIWNSSRRSSSRHGFASRSSAAVAPAFQLATGAQGQLGAETYTVSGSAHLEIARVLGRQQQRMYQLSGDATEPRYLVPGLTRQGGEWLLLAPVSYAPLTDPYEAATRRKGTRIPMGDRSAEIVDLFREKSLAHDGAATDLPAIEAIRYGFVARDAQQWLVARWDESGLQFHAAQPFSEAEIRAAFAATRR